MNVPATLRRVGRGLRALRGLPAVLRLYGRGVALPIRSAPLAGGAYLVLLISPVAVAGTPGLARQAAAGCHCSRGEWRSRRPSAAP